jgi:hypothetical protein
MTVATPHEKHKLQSSPTIWLAIVAAVALVERLLVVLFYQPVAYNDTPSYRRLAETVLQGFADYDGTRTPGYPVFLALTGTDQRAWLAQLFLGLLTTLLMFYIGWKLTHRAWFGGLISLAHTLNLGQLFFESNLITESITTFFLILTMAGVLLWLDRPKTRRAWLAILLGLFSSITLLVRPLFIYLPFFLLAFLWLESRVNKNASARPDETSNSSTMTPAHGFPWRYGIAFILPVVVLLGGWIGFIHQQFNQWSITTMTGYHLVQHTGNFFEYVPDEYAALRDTYIKYRDAHIAHFGTQTNAIWDAIPEMSKVSGYSFYGLSKVLTRISIQLILHHPLLFLKSAASGWWMFWRAPVYWSAEAVKIPSLTGVISAGILIERLVLILANLFFIAASLYFALGEILSAMRHKPSPLSKYFPDPTQHSFLWMLLANLWIASILQTLLDHGDNPRFLVPMQSLVILWVCVFIYPLILSRHTLLAPTTQREPISTLPSHQK